MASLEDYKLNEKELEFIKDMNKKTTSKGNSKNHDVLNKKYEKLSLSLTRVQKQKIKDYKEENYPSGLSISSMIMDILEKKGVFK